MDFMQREENYKAYLKLRESKRKWSQRKLSIMRDKPKFVHQIDIISRRTLDGVVQIIRVDKSKNFLVETTIGSVETTIELKTGGYVNLYEYLRDDDGVEVDSHKIDNIDDIDTFVETEILSKFNDIEPFNRSEYQYLTDESLLKDVILDKKYVMRRTKNVEPDTITYSYLNKRWDDESKTMIKKLQQKGFGNLRYINFHSGIDPKICFHHITEMKMPSYEEIMDLPIPRESRPPTKPDYTNISSRSSKNAQISTKPIDDASAWLDGSDDDEYDSDRYISVDYDDDDYY